MGLDLDVPDDDARYDAWIRIVKRICKEHHDYAWGHYLFRLLRAVFVANEQLAAEGGFLFKWMALNYVDAMLMLLRRELDLQGGTESLRNLLLDMIEHPSVLTRARYLARWEGTDHELVRWHANRTFDGYGTIRVPGQPEADYVDPAIVQADLGRVIAEAEQVRVYAERTRAHRTPEATFDPAATTFNTLHETLAGVRDMIAKYNALLTQGMIGQWEAVPQFSPIQPFTKPWVVDRETVRRLIGKEPGRE
jgi:hypothetical protein